MKTKKHKTLLHICHYTLLILLVSMFTILPGQAYAAPEKDTDGFYMIKTADDLAWLRDGVNNGTIVSSDANAKLMNDIDLAGVGSWVPIGYVEGDSKAPAISLDRSYAGTFDGRLYTISNLTLSAASQNPNLYYHALGLFGITSGATIRNLRLRNINFNADVTVQTINTDAGTVVGNARYKSLVENCHVLGGTLKITSNSANGLLAINAGGIAGVSEYSTVVQNCVVSDLKIDVTNDIGSARAGGVAGIAYGTGVPSDAPTVIRNCLVKDCELTANSPNNTKINNWSAAVGGIAGDYSFSNNDTSVLENCVSQNNTLFSKSKTYAHAGGITAMSMFGLINNCTVSGSSNSITAQSASDDASEIMGTLIADAFFVNGADNYFAAGLLANGTNDLIGENPISFITGTMFDYAATTPDQLPIATVLLDDVMKVVEEGKSVNLSVVTYPGTNSDVTYAWNQDDSNVSLSAAAGDSIGVTGVTADETDYVACVPTPQAVVLSVTDLRCAFRVDAASDPHVPDPPAEPCEGDCGSGCSALPFEWLSVILIPSAAYLLATRKRRT